MRTPRLLIIYIQRYLLTWFGGRGFLITLVAGQAVTPLIGLALWTAAVPGQHVSTYYVALLAVQLMTASYENHTLSQRMYEGDLADDLLLPHPVIVLPLAQNLALRCWHLLFGLPLLLLAGWLAGIQLQLGNLARAIPALVAAAALRFLFTYVLALSAFWTERAHSIVGFAETLLFLLGGAAVPVWLLPGPLRAVGEALPFRAMYGFPAEIAAGRLRLGDFAVGVGLQIAWLVIFAALSAGVWRAGLNRYAAVGG